MKISCLKQYERKRLKNCLYVVLTLTHFFFFCFLCNQWHSSKHKLIAMVSSLNLIFLKKKCQDLMYSINYSLEHFIFFPLPTKRLWPEHENYNVQEITLNWKIYLYLWHYHQSTILQIYPRIYKHKYSYIFVFPCYYVYPQINLNFIENDMRLILYMDRKFSHL